MEIESLLIALQYQIQIYLKGFFVSPALEL